MAKSADAFRTISEVADWLETPAHVLRFWESKFSQVKPVKRAGGRRYYRPADMELLGGIKKLLHDDGMTIKGVQKILREEGVKHVAALSQPLEPGLEDYVDATPLDEASGDDQQDSAEIVAMYPDLQDSGATEEPPAAELTPASGEPDSPPAQDKDDRAQVDFSSDEEEAAVAEEASVDASEAAEVEAEEQIDQGEDQGQEPEPVPEPPAPLAPKPAILDLPEDPTDDMPAEAGLLSRLSTLNLPENEESRHRIRTLMQRLREVSDRPANRRDS